MRNIGFSVNTQIKRPDKTLVEAFRGITVPNIADNMNRMSCVDASIRPFNKTPMLGVAFTVKAPDGDNLFLHHALDLAKPGDIIVVSGVGASGRSFCGEIMMNVARVRGLAGFVIDGFIRDCTGAAEIQFPVYARGVQPNGPYKNGPGEINVPVAVGGQVICPGDILVGDADGIVVIKPEDAAELAAASRRTKEVEDKQLKDLKNDILMDRSWVTKLLETKDFDVY